MLSFIERGIPTRRAFFGEGRGPVHLSRAECTSKDTDLLNCTIDKSAVNGCDHSEDAGVICRGKCVHYDCVCTNQLWNDYRRNKAEMKIQT